MTRRRAVLGLWTVAGLLLVLVLVLRHVTVGIELDHAESDPLAVHDADVHSVPDPLQVE